MIVTMKNLLITGGAGYIGSHAVYKAINKGYNVKVVDSLVTGNEQVLKIIEQLTKKKVDFSKVDIRDKVEMKKIFNEFQPEFVMNFAALKSVGEGEKHPDEYYDNNVNGVTNILKCIDPKTTKLVFSSTAAVYDPFQDLPLTEKSILKPISVYGKTKLECEKLIAKSKCKSVVFRYFNVVGNIETGDFGEYPEKTTNLLPLVLQTLTGKRESVTLFGDKFGTKDGSQERDYIDVNDIVDAHFLAIEKELPDEKYTINLGTGKPTSCLELFSVAEGVTGKKLNYIVGEPRQGDPESSFASADLAKEVLGWSAKRDLKDSITAQWKWMQKKFLVN